MKIQAIAAVAALGVWLAGTAGAQGDPSEKFLALAGSDPPQSVETTRAGTVDRATVSALRQLAIEAGQTSSSSTKKPERSAAALEAERAAIERHRVAFFQRAFGTTTAVAELGGPGADRHPPVATRFAALAGSDPLQSVETARAETVDRATVLSLRQLAIEAGQTSSSSARKPERSAAALDAERGAIDRHRTAFFQRAYGTTTAVAQLGGPGPGRHPPVATRFAELAGPGADRHPPTLTQYVGLPRYAADRHPPISMRFAGLTGPGADRHPPALTRFAELTGPGADRHPPAVTRLAELTGPGLDRHPPIATRFARLAPQEPIEVVLQVGTAADHFAMEPKTLKLRKGELYKLVIVNRSRVTHQVSAPGFGAAIDSASLTGGIVLKPGDRAVWYFTADQEGTYGIACSQMEHAKAGMVGKIIVSEAVT